MTGHETLSSDQALLAELEPTAGALLERHLSASKEWFPHQLVPFGLGEDFEKDYEWSPEDAETPLNDATRSALYVNLLTEDNLPYYFRTIERMFGKDSAWGAWARRWTAEEGRHSIVIRDYLTVTRAIDPIALERARMAQVESGQVPEPETAADGFVYVALQELATRISHHNTGKRLQDEHGQEVMKRVGNDENFHHLFYRDIVKAAIEVDPSAMVMAMERQVRTFEMPGTGIADFDVHAKAIAKAGIYDYITHHDKILVPVVLRQWGLESIEGLSDDAQRARLALLKRIEQIGKAARRLATRAAEDARTTPV